METTKVFVPLFVWLLGGSRIGGSYNAYHGSCTEHPGEAAWGQKVFNYAIYIEKVDERELLKASVFDGLRSFADAAAADALETEVFPCEEESLVKVRAWLEEKRAKFFT